MKPRVIIESPYKANEWHTTEEHVKYAKRALLDSLAKGEAPIASHLLYTQKGILDDNDLYQRSQGIEAGFTWYRVADKILFYVDYGWSGGMLAAELLQVQMGLPYEVRRIGK